MASQAYEQILQIQTLDLNITQLRHRHANHPLRTELANIDGEIEAGEARVAEIEERNHGLERELKRFSDEVATVEARRAEIDGKLYDGSVTASKELLALQEEAAGLLERQRGIEDQELEIMEQLEGVGEELAAARSDLSDLNNSRTRVDEELRDATAELDAEIISVEADRVEAAGPALPELLARYEELSGQFGGVAVARLNDGRCDGCHMQLSAVAVDRLSKAPEDAVVTCEECGRLLVR